MSKSVAKYKLSAESTFLARFKQKSNLAIQNIIFEDKTDYEIYSLIPLYERAQRIINNCYYPSDIRYMRLFIRCHEDYKNESILSMSINIASDGFAFELGGLDLRVLSKDTRRDVRNTSTVGELAPDEKLCLSVQEKCLENLKNYKSKFKSGETKEMLSIITNWIEDAKQSGAYEVEELTNEVR